MIGITLNELCIVVAIALLVGTGIGLAIGFGAWWQAHRFEFYMAPLFAVGLAVIVTCIALWPRRKGRD